MTNWPKHQDGRNKKIGEMTTAERRSVMKDAAARLKVEFENMPAEFFKAPVKVEPVKVSDPWFSHDAR